MGLEVGDGDERDDGMPDLATDDETGAEDKKASAPVRCTCPTQSSNGVDR
jgi:hypothetical protein